MLSRSSDTAKIAPASERTPSPLRITAATQRRRGNTWGESGWRRQMVAALDRSAARNTRDLVDRWR